MITIAPLLISEHCHVQVMEMAKKTLGRTLPMMGLPVVVVGSKVQGKMNFCTIAWATMIDDEPPKMAVVMGKDRRTKDGILENKTFSINLPDAGTAAAVDHCGLVSGYKEDKSHVFDVFFGKTLTAPMARECPVNVELTLDEVIELEGTDIVIGEVEEVYVDEDRMTAGRPDMDKLQLLMYLSSGALYFTKGATVAEAFNFGKDFRPR
ncbi:MAG: Flavin reductase like domain protein [Methanomassiliicoccales archaeon PtaB.Bin215]|nr:MAG: Flavin reductase like domain protein [Methanomassiliicoccales archaeon PtaB.Bin215]